MTRDELLRLAAETDAELRAAIEAGDRARALKLQDRWALLMELAAAPGALTSGKRSPKVDNMDTAHREAISKAHLKSAPMAAARKAGLLTLGDVAKALGCSKSFISQVFSDQKPMPPDKAARFEELTGYRWKS